MAGHTPAIGNTMFELLKLVSRTFLFPAVPDKDIPDVPATKCCLSCEFRSNITDRCLRREGPYYKAPVKDDQLCHLYASDLENTEEKLSLSEPRGAKAPEGHVARFLELEELTGRKSIYRNAKLGCLKCSYNKLRDKGIGFPGCAYPGRNSRINSIDNGMHCPSYAEAPS